MAENKSLSLQEELIAFCRLIIAASKSGLPLTTALEKIKKNNSNKLSENWINELVSKLEKGYSIEEAAKSIKDMDPVLAKLMPLLGNERLVKVFEIYTKYMIKQETCCKQISCLVWYPLLIMLICLAFIIYLNFYSFPVMETLANFNGFIETWSLKLLYFANPSYYPFSFIIPLLLVYFIVDCSIFMITGHFAKFSLWSRLSGLNKAIDMNEKSRLAALLSIYTEAGYSFSEAIEASLSFVGEKNKKELLGMNGSFTAGNNLSEVLSKSSFLSEFLNGKENADELPVKLSYAYDNFNYDTISIIKSVSDRLFYIPLLMAGLMVLLVATGFFGSYNLFMWSIG